jgi:RimJ/RimL family protein N-acetyltransferase
VTDKLATLNRWLNDPAWLKTIGGPDAVSIDGEAFFRNPDNVALFHDNGCGLFIAAPAEGDFRGTYEGHYLFGPRLRGSAALGVARRMISEVFQVYGATSILGQVMADNMPARLMTRSLGFRPIGNGRDPFNRPCVDYVLTRSQWAAARAKDGSKWVAWSQVSAVP